MAESVAVFFLDEEEDQDRQQTLESEMKCESTSIPKSLNTAQKKIREKDGISTSWDFPLNTSWEETCSTRIQPFKDDLLQEQDYDPSSEGMFPFIDVAHGISGPYGCDPSLERALPSANNSLKVMAEGIGDDVRSAVRELRDRLKGEAELSEANEKFELYGTRAQFFRLHCSKETKEILGSFRTSHRLTHNQPTRDCTTGADMQFHSQSKSTDGIFHESQHQPRTLYSREKTPRSIHKPPRPHSSTDVNRLGHRGKETDGCKTIHIGQALLTVNCGDITEEKADILVNIVTDDLSLEKTRISQAFVKKGGTELQEDYGVKRSGSRYDQIIETDKNGKLCCKVVYHLPLEKWNASSSKKLQWLIRECFNKARSSRMKTIVFPFLGSKRLLQYPSDIVLELMVKESKSALEKGNSSLKDVRFVFFDRDHCSAVTKMLLPLDKRVAEKAHSANYSTSSDRHQRINSGTSRFHEESRPNSTRHFSGNNTNITVKLGDITDMMADVLVNVVTSNLFLKSTRISQAFIKKGDNAFIQDYLTQEQFHSASKKDIIITDQIGNLPCKYVYHVPLQKWCDSAADKKLKKGINECLKTANENSLSSIAFPMLGYGPTLKYPKEVVIECIVNEAISFTSQENVNIKEIMLVAYEPSIYQNFCDRLEQILPTAADESEDELTFNELFQKHDCNSSTSTKSIQLFAKDKQRCMQAKQNLEEELEANFLFEDKIDDDSIGALESQMEHKINGLGKNENVIISINKHKGCVYLKGEQSAVYKMMSKVSKILLDSGNNSQMAANTEIKAPKYWKHFTSRISISKLFKSTFKLADIEDKSPTFQAISELVNKTWFASHVGHGKDAQNLNHKSVTITKIERVENLKLYRKYATRRQDIMREAKEGKKMIPIEKIPDSKGHVLTSLTSPPLAVLKPDIYPHINEYYLFHGTKSEVVKAVFSDGLDPRLSDVGAMFGQGIYASESSTKADQYADPKHGRTGGELKMFLIRMVLGKMLLKATADSQTKYRRPPCTHPQCRRDNCTTHLYRYDSVVADGGWLFREFVVYSSDQCYPEYIITYKRN